MATIRVSNIEAKADAGSPTIDERVTFKRSTGENGVVIDSKQVGITSVGIGTDNPTALLNVYGTTSPYILVEDGSPTDNQARINFKSPSYEWTTGLHGEDSGKYKVSYASAHGANDYLTITTNGYVGINTDNPSQALEIADDSITVAKITSLGDDSAIRTTRLDFNFSDGGGGAIAVKRAAGVANTETYLSIRTGGSTNDDEKIRITANGEVGIGTDNPTEKLTVNGNISSDPIFITTYGAGNLDITTEQTVDLDLTLSTSGTSDFTVSATGVITVLKTGTYQVSYSISTDVTTGSARSISRAYLRLNGSGEQTASRTYMYNRLAGSGENTSAKTIMLPLTANDTLELRAVRDSGTDTVVVLENYTTISLVRLT